MILFEASYYVDSDKVVIIWENKKVMFVRNVSESFDVEGKTGGEIANMVLEHNRKIAKGIVEDYIENERLFK